MRIKQLVSAFIGIIILVTSCQKDDLPVYDYRTLGTAARDILSASPYTALELEVNYMPGYLPDDAVINHVKNYLAELTNKPVGITYVPAQFSRTVSNPISLNEVVSLEKSIRTRFTKSQTLAIHIMIVDAEYSTADILGISYWNTSMCVFGRTVTKFSGRPGLVSKNQLMTTLIEHEMGHILGLVDQGTPMVTAHKSNNGAHCTNTSCLMYHIIETSGNSSTPIPTLDDRCRADLRANGGK
jgi:hypothetical protein